MNFEYYVLKRTVAIVYAISNLNLYKAINSNIPVEYNFVQRAFE